ncbi:MAG TPA: hypothetical protein QGH10_15425 [Armatimonadota bacterium]|nr:hypothetical protein [Armatimonadota bacterium]
MTIQADGRCFVQGTGDRLCETHVVIAKVCEVNRIRGGREQHHPS